MTHTSSSERIMLTNITGLINQAKGCKKSLTIGVPLCPLMGTLLAIKKSLQTEVRQKGEDDRNQRP